MGSERQQRGAARVSKAREVVAKAVQIPGKLSLDQMRVRGLIGTPETIRHRLREIEQAGVQEVIVFLRDGAQGETLRLLAQSLHYSENGIL
jgi:alkanesulfonate monooxygenase SsuD/methylene tetrahydromethanopterin reductase-like flavin-dependent oxidoreductase (luciferase family)